MLSIYKLLIKLLVVFVIVISLQFKVEAAEIIQIRSSNVIQIGDRNRTYSVKLFCVKVPSENEKNVVEFMRSELPRRKKVNLRPVASVDGMLIAKVIINESGLELGELISDKGLGENIC